MITCGNLGARASVLVAALALGGCAGGGALEEAPRDIGNRNAVVVPVPTQTPQAVAVPTAPTPVAKPVQTTATLNTESESSASLLAQARQKAAQGVTSVGRGITSLFAPTDVSALPSDTLFASPGPGVSVVIPPIQGAPAEQGQVLARQIQALLGGAIDGKAAKAAPSAFILSGYASAAAGSRRTSLIADWRIFDRRGEKIGEFFEQQTVAEGARQDPWASINPDVLSAIAARVADRVKRNPTVASALGGANVAGLTPPAFERAPRFEAAPPPSFEGLQPAAQPQQTGQQATPSPAAKTAKPAAPAKPVAATKGPRPIVIGSVVGAPGDGDQALALAIARQLAAAGAPVANSAKGAFWRVDARVTRTNRGATDNLKIIWSVSDGQQVLGEVTQENDLPAGALDGGWGQDADFAAQGATNGILALINRAGS